MPANGSSGIDVQSVPVDIKSKGRMAENNATCATDVAADPACGPSSPKLALNPGPNSKWRFEPAGGGIMRYYIRQDVSGLAICCASHSDTLLLCQSQQLCINLQSRVQADCARSYLGIGLSCNETRTELVTLGNTSASLVWLVEPVLPTAPRIANASIAANVLTVLLTPPEFQGFYRKSRFFVTNPTFFKRAFREERNKSSCFTIFHCCSNLQLYTTGLSSRWGYCKDGHCLGNIDQRQGGQHDLEQL